MHSAANEYKSFLKNKFKTNGIDSLPERELLELILFYSMPASVVAKCADALFERFGTLGDILGASYESLREVPELTQNGAIFIRMLPEMCRQYSLSSLGDVNLTDINQLKELFLKQFYGVDKELVKIALLDNRLKIIQLQTLSGSDTSSVAVDVKKIVTEVINSGCTGCIISHNHPQGNCAPSQDDIVLTKNLRAILNNLGVRLYDHVIVGKDGVWSIRGNGKL